MYWKTQARRSEGELSVGNSWVILETEAEREGGERVKERVRVVDFSWRSSGGRSVCPGFWWFLERTEWKAGEIHGPGHSPCGLGWWLQGVLDVERESYR